jgi:hypothetical protein
MWRDPQVKQETLSGYDTKVSVRKKQEMLAALKSHGKPVTCPTGGIGLVDFLYSSNVIWTFPAKVLCRWTLG